MYFKLLKGEGSVNHSKHNDENLNQFSLRKGKVVKQYQSSNLLLLTKNLILVFS